MYVFQIIFPLQQGGYRCFTALGTQALGHFFASVLLRMAQCVHVYNVTLLHSSFRVGGSGISGNITVCRPRDTDLYRRGKLTLPRMNSNTHRRRAEFLTGSSGPLTTAFLRGPPCSTGTSVQVPFLKWKKQQLRQRSGSESKNSKAGRPGTGREFSWALAQCPPGDRSGRKY